MKKMTYWFLFLLAPITSWSLPQICTISQGQKTSKIVINAIPSREQWNSTNGYCGEVSLISAGLYYGQYVSQYDARRLVNLNFQVKNKQLDQMLIGYKGSTSKSNNILQSLQQMHLTYEQFNNTQQNQTSKEFLLWVKKHVVEQHPVAIGVYENTSIFDNGAQPDYDHIVPVFGIQSTHNLLPLAYYADDIIYFHDNKLYTETASDCYHYLFSVFQKTRAAANKEDGDIYSLSNNANQLGNFGVAITGVRVGGGNLMPVTLQTNPIYEYPAIKDNSDVRPKPELITLTIQVSGLEKQKYYILYKYTDFNQLPANDNFALSKGSPVKTCSIFLPAGGMFTTREQTLSNSMAIYRAVAASPDSDISSPCS